MLIYCFDNELKQKLLNNGYKILPKFNIENGCVFADVGKFDFTTIDKSKYKFTNRLNF